MRRLPPGVVLGDRDRVLFAELFENRAMLHEQLYAGAFSGTGKQAALNRLCKLVRDGFIDRQYICGRQGKILAVFANTPKSLNAIANTYRYTITSALCKSDSVEHDIQLVYIRRRLEKLALATGYYTENMLQACSGFAAIDGLRPFVQNNTDAVIEVTRNKSKILVGIEFENSEKAQERYVRKLVSYYASPVTPVIFYICGNARIKKAVVNAEMEMIGQATPRCFYSMLDDVLNQNVSCTFTDLQGGRITLT